jgi:hypothetical protein
LHFNLIPTKNENLYAPICRIARCDHFADDGTEHLSAGIHSLSNQCTAGCHSGSTPTGNLDLSLDSATLYSHLINGTPTNPAALSEGLKLIVPGYPYRSYLMKKVNHGLDPANDLNMSEGLSMPNSGPALSKRNQS